MSDNPGSGRQEPGAPPLARLGMKIAGACERFFPDAFIFALTVVLLVFAAGLLVGEAPGHLIAEFGNGFWVLIPFTMQMVLIIVGGFVVASSPPVARLIRLLAGFPKSPRSAVAFIALFSMLASLLSWGLSLVFTGLLVREIAQRVKGLDYRAAGAAAYLGLGSVWGLGLSSSAALLQATPSSIPPTLLPITGVIPLSQTVFLWQSLFLVAVLIAASVAIAFFSCPRPKDAKTFEAIGVRFGSLMEESRPPATPAEKAEHSPLLSVVVGLLMVAYLASQFLTRGGLAAVDLNNFNFAFLAAGLLLHWRPRSFLNAVSKSVPATAGVLIQFPFYAGIFGLIANTSLSPLLAEWFVRLTTKGTYPVAVGIYSAVLGLFVPSGGGKWIIEAPYVMSGAVTWEVHLGWMVQVYNAAETLPNLINPFWMLPLMGILNVRARDLAGYSILQLLFHIPIVLFLSWALALTLDYQPPIMP